MPLLTGGQGLAEQASLTTTNSRTHDDTRQIFQMKLYSTHNRETRVTFERAVFQSLPADGGLYMPQVIPALAPSFLASLPARSFQEIALEVSRTLLGDDIPEAALKNIIDQAVDFPAPVVKLDPDTYALELFHGPSMAFKDFGARFMSRVMAYFLQKERKRIHILVATSGDTGGAVAMGFYEVPDIEVTILYPSGKVSPIQEKQLATLGGNISALEVEGTFDDCQRLVKQAFLDPSLNEALNLSSANSINIARLIPQTFYYFNAYAQLRKAGDDRPVVFSVPSGNFGNLTAGLIARRMGLPVRKFIASTNVNDEVPRYLRSGVFDPRPSMHTLSNAMDVGNPSNFARMLDLFDHDVHQMNAGISGYSFTDEQTLETIRAVAAGRDYVVCPHTAVAYAGLKRFLAETGTGELAGIFLSTAHPCKFPGVYDAGTKAKLTYPPQARALENKQKEAVLMDNDFGAFKRILMKDR
jgi:threonine synthase